MVDDRQAAIGTEHAQAMRHVVQRGVELVRQRRLALAAISARTNISCKPVVICFSARKNSALRHAMPM